MSVYPTSIKTYTTKVNHIDVYDADHINSPQDEIIALQTYIGTNPHGSRPNLVARLNVMIGSYGGIQGGTGFPAETTPRRLFYRDDLEALYIRRADGTGEQAVGNSFSNVLFQYTGVIHQSTTVGNNGELSGMSSLTSTSNTAGFRYIRQNNSGGGLFYQTAWTNSWIKTNGVNTITPRVRLWVDGADSLVAPVLRLTIGSVISTTRGTIGSSAPSWATGAAMDVSGLVAGSVYDVVGELASSGSTGSRVYCSDIIGWGS